MADTIKDAISIIFIIALCAPLVALTIGMLVMFIVETYVTVRRILRDR